jgi:hypothetical protein
MTTDLRYPIGRFQRPTQLTDTAFADAIVALAALPAQLRSTVAGLSASQLDTPYRPDGWTVRQVVHHVADSHMNAYLRVKSALTEEDPTIRPYDEKRWAEQVDSARPIDGSLAILDGVHDRWVALVRDLPPAARARTFQHPESGAWRVDQAIALYAWHGAHHQAHVNGLRERSGWR